MREPTVMVICTHCIVWRGRRAALTAFEARCPRCGHRVQLELLWLMRMYALEHDIPCEGNGAEPISRLEAIF